MVRNLLQQWINRPLAKVLLGSWLMLVPGYALGQAIPQPSPLKVQPAPGQETQSEEAPKPEPTQPVDARIYQSACPALLRGEIVGTLIEPIEEGRCGERSPIEVTRIGTVALSSPVVMNCRMATAMTRWIDAIGEPGLQHIGSQIKTLTTSTGYNCRRRNNAPDGKISEHGFANAIDIVGFQFEDGTNITLETDWGPVTHSEESEGSQSSEATAEEAQPEALSPSQVFLREARDKACEQFTTVLGPEADRFHTTHFHFDLGCHGRKCTYLICE